jgi:hypothetical protein
VAVSHDARFWPQSQQALSEALSTRLAPRTTLKLVTQTPDARTRGRISVLLAYSP